MNSSPIPIFDSLTHPSLDGTWIHPRWNGTNTFPLVVETLRAANVRWAWAVSMGTTGPYDMERYVDACAQSGVTLFPAAFMEVSAFTGMAQAEDWLLECRRLGFRGVKLHPRVARFDFRHPLLADIISACNRLGLVPLLCSYFYSRDPACQFLTIETLRELLYRVPDERLILLHGGSTRLLDVSEMTRPFKQVLLDLSWTLCEFEGSSLDLDLRYVLDRCRHRVCIGTDSPEYAPARMRERFERLTEGFSREHRELIAFRNMFERTGLPGADAAS